MSDTTKPNGAKWLNLQARKIITKHKNLFVFRELHLNLQREGLAGWRDHPSILFLHSSIYGAPTIMCQVVYGNSREQNRQNPHPQELIIFSVPALSSGLTLLLPCPGSMRLQGRTGQIYPSPPEPGRTYKTLHFRTQYRDQPSWQRINFPYGQIQVGSRGPTPRVPLVWMSLQLLHWL